MKSSWDYVALATIVVAYLIAFSTPLRVPLGIILLCYLPGYALVNALFPSREAITTLERQGIAVGLSIAMLPVQAIALRYLQIPFRLESIFTSVLIITSVGIAISTWQRWRLGELAYRPGIPTRNQIFSLIFSVVVVASFAVAILSVARPGTFTEFYFGGEGVNVSEIFRNATLNDALSVSLVIVNQEQQTQKYYYELWIEDSWANETQMLLKSDPFELDPDAVKTLPTTWQMPTAGSDQQVHFYLFKMDSDSPYRQLTLWIDVMDR